VVGSPRIAVVGLGSMGRAIATALAREGSMVTGWNRTPREVEGVRVQTDVAEAVRGADLVIAVPMSYANSREALAPVAAAGGLRDVALLNLSWGTLDDAVQMQAWCATGGADYLDGSLLCYPDEIGTEAGRIVFSGSSARAEEVGTLISPLGPASYLGEDPVAANAVGTAAGMVFYHAALAAFYEAIAFASRFGVAPAALLPELRGMLDLLSTHFEADIARIESDDYANPSASIDVHLDGVRMAIADMAAAGQPSPLMAGFAQLVQPLVDDGLGDQSIARLFGHLTSPPGH